MQKQKLRCPDCGNSLYIVGCLTWYCNRCIRTFYESECNKEEE